MIETLAEALVERGYGVVPDFFPPLLTALLRTETRDLLAENRLRAAGVGRGGDYAVRGAVRNDRILWLDEHSASAAQSAALERLTTLRDALNRRLFLGLRSSECHLAAYGAGGHYDKHLDAFRGALSRKLSFIVYLNETWREEDGGALRLYDRDAPNVPARDVWPLGGTLACFLSEEIWHEVRPTARERLSLTGWFRG